MGDVGGAGEAGEARGGAWRRVEEYVWDVCVCVCARSKDAMWGRCDVGVSDCVVGLDLRQRRRTKRKQGEMKTRIR